MISGSNYVRVEANAVMPMAEGVSGNQGFEIAGSYVNWTTDGITGGGWSAALTMAYSPFLGKMAKWVEGDPDDPNDILYLINKYGNLNQIFSAWGTSTTDEERYIFIGEVSTEYGWTSKGGCIGDKLA